jgi:hypothetical protein
LERSPVTAATAFRAVSRIADSFLDLLTAPRQPGAASDPPPAPEAPERDDTLQRLEQAQKAGEAARQAEEQQRLAEQQRKDKFIEEYKRKMAQAKGLRLKP